MSEEIKTEVQAQEPETFEGWLQGRLDKMAVEDPAFAEKLANPKKSLRECVEYITGEVFERYMKAKSRKERVAVAKPSREECFGLAVHYYDEEDVKVRPLPNGVGSNMSSMPKPPSKEEQEKMRAEAMAKMEKQFEEEARKKIEEREKARKAAEAEKKKAEREKREAEKKAAGEFSLFDLMSL